MIFFINLLTFPPLPFGRGVRGEGLSATTRKEASASSLSPHPILPQRERAFIHAGQFPERLSTSAIARDDAACAEPWLRFDEYARGSRQSADRLPRACVPIQWCRGRSAS